MPSPSFEKSVRAAAAHRHHDLAADIRRLRADAGLTVEQLGRAAGVDPSYLRRIEDRLEPPDEDMPRRYPRPSVLTYQRLAAALGADLATRLYPNTGPLVRDRHQAKMAEVVLAALHPRWAPFPEVRVRTPARGWIDLALHDRVARALVAAELESGLHHVEQLVRWSMEKAASIGSWDGWKALGSPPEVSRLLVVRRTRAAREVAATFAQQLRLAYPAHPADAVAALTGVAPWPGPAMVWAVLDGARSHLVTER
jgi:transcriptional regulator with XRE-family HTH domain